MSKIIYEINREIPVVKEADVVVVGGGPGGLGAAVMAARSGVKTLLVERYGQLGGMASLGEVHPFMTNHHNGICMDKPVYVDWVRKMLEYLPPEIKDGINDPSEVDTWLLRSINKDVAALAAEDLCLEAGVELLYHHQLADVIVKDRVIESIVLLSKSGFVAAKGKIYVDCTGDADLAAKADCEFEMGDEKGNCQPMTTCFKLSHVVNSELEDWGSGWRAKMQELYEKAKAEGKMSCPRENILMFAHYDKDIVHFNSTRVQQHDGTDGLRLSAAEIEGRKQVREYIKWLRDDVAGFENAQLHSMAFHIGIRETRRIKGLNYITRKNFEERTKFDDAIARCNYPIDIHSPTGGATELVHMKKSEYYEIPYGCIVPKDIDNLTVGGRPISVDVAVHSSMRVMPPACSIGQAAGVAAATAVEKNCKPKDIDGCEIRQKLKAAGAYL